MIICNSSVITPIIREICGRRIPVYTFNTVIVGTGCAGFNAADCLFDYGCRDIAIVTEGLNMGTSRNTGSDKQTYYKLTLSGKTPDSVYDMAETLYSGGSMHGDIALTEAAMSLRNFFKLVLLGVPFPHNEYGEYVGYKTDHDPRSRATSCGPLTSRIMTEQLEKSVRSKDIPVFDGYRVISIITNQRGAVKNAVGLLCISRDSIDDNFGLTLFNCTNIIYATGGPSAIYKASVYPESQNCSIGAAFEAGAEGVNLTESQYGIASVKFRWNLSGTYQQAIPRYFSQNPDGSDEREFLQDYFPGKGEMINAIFLKGYQWPFDPGKINNCASSVVDLAVYIETRIKKRKAFIDFTRNPSTADINGRFDFDCLSAEAMNYIENSDGLCDSPVQRLISMNKKAYLLYKNNGIDLTREPLEIDVCAQHNNGGLLGNIWWESNIRHLFPVGECNGSFGVYRPGGSALNSTQTGSSRAAQFISENYMDPPAEHEEFIEYCAPTVSSFLDACDKLLSGSDTDKKSIFVLREKYQNRFYRCGAIFRNYSDVCTALDECRQDLINFEKDTLANSPRDLTEAFINKDILITQFVYLSAIKAYIEKGGKSRGSYIITQHSPEQILKSDLQLDNGNMSSLICRISYSHEKCPVTWDNVRPIPDSEQWFEKVYNLKF